MHFIMDPTQTLRYANSTPFGFTQETKCSGLVRVEEMFGNELKEWLGQYDMAVFELVVTVSFRVMDSTMACSI